MPVKKKTAHIKKAAPKKTVRKRTTRRAVEPAFLLPFTFRRIVLITTAVALFLVVGTLFKQEGGRQAVAGISITRGLFDQANVTIPDVTGASSYNIYFKKTSEADFNNAVRGIGTDLHQYTISYLTKGASYEYKIAARDANGEEFWFSEIKPLDTTSM